MKYDIRLVSGLTLALLAGCGSNPPTVFADAEVDTGVVDAGRDVPVTDLGSPVDVVDASLVDVPVDNGNVAVDGSVTDTVTVDGGAETGVDAGTDAVVNDAVVTDAGGNLDVLTDATDPGDGSSGQWVTIPGGACNARERRYAEIPSPHVDPDAGPIMWLSNPPSSGPHFGSWARWGGRANIPRGNWVHNLEHGGVTFLHRCTSGTCDSVQSMLLSATNSFPNDPACMPTDAEPARLRVIVTNDAEIETPIAGAAWGWVYAADCIDPASMRTFFTTHVGHAPEDFCFEGSI